MTDSLLDVIERMLPEIVEKCEKLPFFSIEPDGSKAPFNLKAVMDRSGSRNKCGFVAQTIADNVDFGSIAPGVSAQFTGIQSPTGNHYAVLLSQAGESDYNSVILDFTARQFDADADFPLVMDCWKWQEWTESRLGRQGNWYHSYAW